MASVREYADQVLQGDSTAADMTQGKRRKFGFTIEIAEDGHVFVDWRGDSILTFKLGRGWFVSTNHFVLNGNDEEERIEQMWTNVGKEVGRRQAAEALAAKA